MNALTKCICNSDRFTERESQYYEVTPEGETVIAKNGSRIKLAECLDCGVIRQTTLPFVKTEYKKYYQEYQPVNEQYKAKDYDHDLRIAKLRANDYGIYGGCELILLDVGSGSGAFVDECRSRGAAAYGCEISQYAYAPTGNFIYNGMLEDIAFPTDHFDVVTCHDVLEHCLDPVSFIKEMFRITKQGGKCIIDFPNFHVEAGKHHWKIEHIWYFNTDQLKELLAKTGFIISGIKNPIESKILFTCAKPEEDRKTILLPPGIGDSYWSLIKLPALIERENIGIPEIAVACNKEKKYNGHKRAFPFIEMFPFVHSSGFSLSTDGESNKKIWKEAYAQEGRTIFRDVLNCNYFVSYNGHLRIGKSMNEIDPDLKCSWNPKMFVSLEQLNFQKMCQEQFGKYIVFYFIFGGTYSYWTQQFPIKNIIGYIRKVLNRTGLKAVFTGAIWDGDDNPLNEIKKNFPDSIDLVGKTTVQQLFGLLKGSELVVGYPSGLTILSASMGIKTLTIWNDYYNRDFAWNCVQPEVWNKTYFTENTNGINVNSLTTKSIGIIEGIAKPSKLPLPTGKREVQTKKNEKVIKSVELKRSPCLTIACVLKSGGDYDEKYVQIMKRMIEKTVTIPYKFCVLTDMNVKDIELIILKKNFPGWWSKLELFSLYGPVLYIDLDTVILHNIDKLVNSVSRMDNGQFWMLPPFNSSRREKGMWASGIMAWHGDFRYLIDKFDRKNYEGWDQVYISKTLEKRGVKIESIGRFSRIASYKRHCSSTSNKPNEFDIVCFHGRERPHTCKHQWVKEIWV